ncbi:MAG: PIN domain-containing protein [Bryobacteraceae bacterium]|nr:PIN domain-containing protein [Bryobacteraceae bacterium]
MPGDKVFFDTNVLIYAFAEGDPRSEIATKLLGAGGVVGVQTLNEFVAVATGKLGMTWKEVLDALQAIRVLCPSVAPITLRTHETALRIAERHGFHIYDSLVIAAALEASCGALYSEDLQHGQHIEGLIVRNPFLA